MRAARRTWAMGLGIAALAVASACGGDSEGQEAIRVDAQLEARVAKLLPQIEEFSHLTAVATPVVRRSNRETLELYLLERLEAEFPGDSLESLAAAYEAFGLIPDTLNLRRLLVDLLLEQAIGYYDPRRDVLFVRDEAPEELLDAVLVHELVHALQDQRVDLDSLTDAASQNDSRAAIQAAIEGHATAAMMAWQFSQGMGASLSAEQLPEVGPEMAAALVDPVRFPQLAAAPTIVRDPMLFAYLGGARYVQRLWRQFPHRPPPFENWLPESTEQLLHTERLLQFRDSPASLAVAEPGGGWRVRYAHDLGELEIGIYFGDHLSDRALAARVAAGWDGDAYALLSRGDEQALIWYTAWDSPADAQEFADAYRTAFAARFEGEADVGGSLRARQRQAWVERLTISGVPVVRVVEAPPGVRIEPPPALILQPGDDR